MMGYTVKSEFILAYWSARGGNMKMMQWQWDASNNLPESEKERNCFCKPSTFHQCTQEGQIAYDSGFYLTQQYFMFSIWSFTKPTVCTFCLGFLPLGEKKAQSRTNWIGAFSLTSIVMREIFLIVAIRTIISWVSVSFDLNYWADRSMSLNIFKRRGPFHRLEYRHWWHCPLIKRGGFFLDIEFLLVWINQGFLILDYSFQVINVFLSL